MLTKNIRATQPALADMDKYIQEIASIWDTRIMTNNGEKVSKFQKALSEYTGCNHIDLFVNGHSALWIAMKALQLEGKVITSPFTFVSTTNAIIQNGLIPVFGDIDESYNLDPRSIEELITEETCAIITPHIFGIPCNVLEIEKIAKKCNLKVIYDGAQAFGTKMNGKSIGHFGDMTMFSFHAIKILNSIEGGALVYKDADLHRSFELYRNFGISYNEMGNDVDVIGINAKMNEFQAAMGIVNLAEFDDELIKRKRLAENYCECLSGIPGISTYAYKKDIDYNYAYFPIKVTDEYGMSRDELWTKLQELGIGTRKLYDKLTCDYNCYKELNFIRKTSNADQVKNIALDLPIYGTLPEDDVLYVCEAIKKLRK